MAVLVVAEVKGIGEKYTLDDDPVVVGRDPSCGITIADETVSRFHARISRTDSGWRVEDLESKNGVFLEGERVEYAPLKHRSRLRFGRVGALFVDRDSEVTGVIDLDSMETGPAELGEAEGISRFHVHPPSGRSQSRVSREEQAISMAPASQFEGECGTYEAETLAAFKYGRTSVFLQVRDQKGEQVCIKLFRAIPRDPSGNSMLKEFWHELDAQRRVVHPNILPILDWGMARRPVRAPFLVLPLCVGGDLRERMHGRSFFPLSEAIIVLRQLAAAIDHAHATGFVHGDIKPENVLFRDETLQGVCLSDFGVAKYFEFAESVVHTTSARPRPGRGGGTTSYLSPEQLRDGVQYPQSDLYALAMIAYELLTGRRPTREDLPPLRQMQTKVDGDIVDPSDANPNISEVARQALLLGLSVDPRLRPRTAALFCELLMGQAREEAAAPRRVPESGVESTGASSREGSAGTAAGKPVSRSFRVKWNSLSLADKVKVAVALTTLGAAVVKAVMLLLG